MILNGRFQLKRPSSSHHTSSSRSRSTHHHQRQNSNDVSLRTVSNSSLPMPQSTVDDSSSQNLYTAPTTKSQRSNINSNASNNNYTQQGYLVNGNNNNVSSSSSSNNNYAQEGYLIDKPRYNEAMFPISPYRTNEHAYEIGDI